MNDIVLSSTRTDWATPRAFFAAMHAEFSFDIDVCANAENACLPRYWTETDDALSQDWSGLTCWMNPPYSNSGLKKWLKKAYDESRKGAVVVCLIPARTETAWWHDYVIRATEIRFIRGRLQFGGGTGNGHNATFPSAVVVFHGCANFGQVTYMDRILDTTPQPGGRRVQEGRGND